MAMSIEGNPRMRFEGGVDLVPYNSRLGIAAFSKPTTESEKTLEDELDREADDNPSFQKAWTAAGREKSQLSKLVHQYKTTLKKSEIKLIMAYTYEGKEEDPKFYSELNEDFRDSDLTGGRFPNAKRILRNALIKLGEFQKKGDKTLRDVLYRWEPSFLAEKYRKQEDKSMHLNMFTSTSLRKDCPHKKENNMQVEFRKPETGAFIRDFSFYSSEDEVLLPPLHGKIKVIKASEDGSKLQGPVL